MSEYFDAADIAIAVEDAEVRSTRKQRVINQYALGYKAGLEAAVKVCHDIERKRWEVMRDGGSFVGWTPKDVAEAIAALPIQGE